MASLEGSIPVVAIVADLDLVVEQFFEHGARFRVSCWQFHSAGLEQRLPPAHEPCFANAQFRLFHHAVERQPTAPEPFGNRITHVFQVADADEQDAPLQYVETMDVEAWENITQAIDVMTMWTRAEGWTVSITVVQLNLPRSE